MKTKAVLLLIVVIFLFSANSVFAYSFSRNLQIGSVGEDVRQLQIILNSNISTKISSSGSGSPGNETTFFGSRTKSALVRFQNNNKISATGFFGPITRAKINSLGKVSVNTPAGSVASTNANIVKPQVQLFPSSAPTSAYVPSSFQTANSDQNSTQNSSVAVAGASYFFGAVKVADMPEARAVRLFQVSPKQISSGGTIKLTGYNITTDSVFNIGDSYSAPVSKSIAGDFQATLPANISAGKYSVWLTDSNSSSKSGTVSLSINVVQ